MKKFILALLALTLIAVLVHRFEPLAKLPKIDNEFHAHYIDNIKETHTAAAGLSAEMLRIQNGQRTFYDILELELKEVQRRTAVLLNTPEFVRKTAVLDAMTAHAEKIDETAASLGTEVQLFKQYFSLLQNSRTYLPHLAAALREQAQSWPQFEAAIADTVYRVMEATYLSSTRIRRETIVEQTQQLLDDRPSAIGFSELWMLKAHVDIVLSYDREVKLISKKIDSLILPQLLDSLNEIERQYRTEHARAQTDTYYLQLFGLGFAGLLSICLLSLYGFHLLNKRRLQAATQKETVQREINDQLDQLVQQKTVSLQKANEELSQFAYRASHDLKSPLVAITALSDCILLDLESGDVEEAIENTCKIGERSACLTTLVMDIMELSRADLADEDVAAVDIEALFGYLEKAVMDAKNYSRVELRLVDQTTGPLYSQSRRLEQLIYNLVSNGFKYANLDRDSCFVDVVFSNTSGGLQLEIADNGVGIPEKFHDKMFQRFQRFHPDMATGSGLGMSIVKSNLDRLGATVEFNSSLVGTRFIIRFPAEQALAEAA